MKCAVYSLLLLGLALSSGDALASMPRSGSFPCEWVSGRLSTYNGTPTFRIWPKGSHRLLGVVSAVPDMDSESDAILPKSVSRLNPGFERDIWGDFKVCPVVEKRKGWMRFVVLKDGRRLRGVSAR